MTDETVYTVMVTREDGHWLASVQDLEGAHTFARTLPALVQAVRKVVVLAADITGRATPELDMEATEVRHQSSAGLTDHARLIVRSRPRGRPGQGG